jgi:hypothetical protein
LSGVVLEKVSQVIRRHDVIHRDNVDLLTEQALFNYRPKYQTSNPSEPVDSNFGHGG